MGNYCDKNGSEVGYELDKEISLAKRNVSSPTYKHNMLESTAQNNYLKDKLQQISLFSQQPAIFSNNVPSYKSNSTTQNSRSASQPSTASNSNQSTKKQLNFKIINQLESKNKQSGAGARIQGAKKSQLDKFIYPAPGAYGQSYYRENLITVYSPMNFEIFQVRVHNVMSLQEFKSRIAQRFETYADNIIIGVGDNEYSGNSGKIDEGKLNIQNDLGINEKTVVKVTFKNKPIFPKKEKNSRSKSKSGYSSSVVNSNGLMNLYMRYQEQMNGRTSVLEEYKLNESNIIDDNNIQDTQTLNDHDTSKDSKAKINVSNRLLFEQKSSKYANNVKLMQRLKEKVSKNLFLADDIISQETSPIRQIITKTNDSNNNYALNYPGSFLSRISNEPAQEHVTTVIVSNKTFDSGSTPQENPKIQVKTCGISQQSSMSVYKKSFMQELVLSQAGSTKNEFRNQKTIHGEFMTSKNNQQLFEKSSKMMKSGIQKKSELKESVKKKMMGNLIEAESRLSRMLKQ
ncbi:UNKNOWN [Stylonychia lemnae]|uniref:Uncharacterized protein n=1 Tax=Stylonychia lemnae TaxID=5949 RepID=A0A078ACW6_STYLE|nr:UNKNOWN [Stylonychia lemnae]|eukprot:CDW78693.1 UNKNOWN [Stylonychia lemnae]